MASSARRVRKFEWREPSDTCTKQIMQVPVSCRVRIPAIVIASIGSS
jgi:hypothetical protein